MQGAETIPKSQQSHLLIDGAVRFPSWCHWFARWLRPLPGGSSALRRMCLLLGDPKRDKKKKKSALGWLWLNDDLPAALLWSAPVIHNGWTAAKMKSVDRTLRGVALRRKGEWMAGAEQICHYRWQLCQWDVSVCEGGGGAVCGWVGDDDNRSRASPEATCGTYLVVHWEEK